MKMNTEIAGIIKDDVPHIACGEDGKCTKKAEFYCYTEVNAEGEGHFGTLKCREHAEPFAKEHNLVMPE